MRYSTYDGNKSGERSVQLDKTEGHIVIEGRAYPAKEIVEALAQSGYSEIRSDGDSLVLGNRRIAPIFKSRQDKAMASVCHGSLSYCCPLSKRCAERDRALEILGLTMGEYERLKGDAHTRFVETARGLSNLDPSWSQHTTSERLANRPARDPGYGSDDYRQDFEALDRTMKSLSEQYGESSDSWRDKPDSRSSSETYLYQPRDNRMLGEATNNKVCSSQLDESIEGIGSLFAQGELSPFTDDARQENDGHSFCFSCGRSIKSENRVCPYCSARQ
ncbi:MAG: RING finger protein [Candidatus Thorarchaeota archaeon]|jgi:hypothetical protein